MSAILLAVSVGFLSQYEPAPNVVCASAPVATPAITAGDFVAPNSRPSPEPCCATSVTCLSAGKSLWLKPPGDLIQHQSPSTFRTHYYFRPYSPSHISVQKEAAATYGTNPRIPYSNAVFRQVYESVESQVIPRRDEGTRPQ